MTFIPVSLGTLSSVNCEVKNSRLMILIQRRLYDKGLNSRGEKLSFKEEKPGVVVESDLMLRIRRHKGKCLFLRGRNGG